MTITSTAGIREDSADGQEDILDRAPDHLPAREFQGLIFVARDEPVREPYLCNSCPPIRKTDSVTLYHSSVCEMVCVCVRTHARREEESQIRPPVWSSLGIHGV